MRRILVGYDGSEGARRALARAAALCDEDTELEVVGAVQLLTPGKGSVAVIDPIEVELREQDLKDAAALLADLGISARTVETHGDPADCIVQRATEVDADLVVVGTHGRGPVGRALLGSVSTRVVQHAPCDVLVVR